MSKWGEASRPYLLSLLQWSHNYIDEVFWQKYSWFRKVTLPLLALAALGNAATHIGSFLFESHYPWRPMQVGGSEFRQRISDVFAEKLHKCKWALYKSSWSSNMKWIIEYELHKSLDPLVCSVWQARVWPTSQNPIKLFLLLLSPGPNCRIRTLDLGVLSRLFYNCATRV